MGGIIKFARNKENISVIKPSKGNIGNYFR